MTVDAAMVDEASTRLAGVIADTPLELSSLTLVEVVTELEERFGLTVAAADVSPQNFRSISSITAYIERHRV